MSDRRLFFALWPSNHQRQVLRDNVEPLLSTIDGKHTDPGNWHVTLFFIGAFPETRIAELREAVAEIECPPFLLQFDQANYWPRPKVACLQATEVPEELTALVDNINEALLPFGKPPAKYTFKPHITIARKAGSFQSRLLAPPVELHWSGFELVESISIPGGVRYRIIQENFQK